MISLLVYHLVHMLRHRWASSARNIMATQSSGSPSPLPTDANITILLRTTTQPKALHKKLYQALDLKPDPIGKRKQLLTGKNP